MVFGKKAGKKAEPEEIPEEFVVLVAKNLFDKYGDAIAESVNKKISQHLDPLRDKVAQMEKEIQHLKATSDEKVKDLLKSTIEVAMESVAEKSAKKAVEQAVEHVGLDKIESLNESMNVVKMIQMEMAEKIGLVSKALNAVEKTLSELSKTLEDVSTLSGEIRLEIDKSLEQFREKMDNAVNRAVKSIRENVVVDKGLIESVVSQSLSRMVSSKFADIESKIEGVSSRMDVLSKSVEELKKMEDSLNMVISKIEDLGEAVNELQVQSPPITQEELRQKTQEVKESQDIEDLSHLVDIE